MKCKLMTSCLISVLTFATLANAQQDKELYDVARGLLKSSDKAIVHIKGTIEITAQGDGANGQRQENKTECLATVIDNSGLAVCSLASLDPTSMIGTIRAGGRVLKIKGEISDLKYRLSDGTEIPGRVLLKDDDLDLAFIAPETALDDATKAKIAVISLDNVSKEASLLDEVIYIGRTGKAMNYEPTLTISQVMTKLSKPRLEYIAPSQQVGCPAFSRDGKLLGFSVIHRTGDAEVTAENRGQRETTPIVLPTSEIIGLIPQAKEEQAKPVKKPAPTTEATTQPSDKTNEK